MNSRISYRICFDRIQKWLLLVLTSLSLEIVLYAQAPVSRGVAVLTFDNLTGDASNDWIGAGFGETMTNKLNNVNALRMQGRRQLNDLLLTRGWDQKKIRENQAEEVGRLLGVDYLLIGSVQAAADISNPEAELYVNARIVDVHTAQILQTLAIRGKMMNLLGLQTALAMEFIRKLGVETTVSEQNALAYEETKSLEAYRYYAMGNDFLDQTRYKEAIEMYKLAMAKHGGIFYAEANHNKVEAYLRLAAQSGDARDSVLTQLVHGEKKKVSELAPIFFNLAQAEELNGNFDKAAEAYRTFIDYCDSKLLRWKFTSGKAIVAAPKTYQENMVFTASDNYVYNVQSVSGQLKWKNKISDKPQSEPFIFEGKIYLADEDENLFAVHALHGQLIWTKHISGLTKAAPWVSDGLVVVGLRTGHVAAFRSAGGDPVWKTDIASPILGSTAGRDAKIYVGTQDGTIACLDQKTGRLLWKTRLEGTIPTKVSPDKTMLFAVTEQGFVVALDPVSGQPVWKTNVDGKVTQPAAWSDKDVFVVTEKGTIVALNKADGVIRWTYQSRAKQLTAPQWIEQLVYIGADDHNVYAIHSQTGKLAWRYETNAEIASEPMILSGVVYVGTGDGGVYAISEKKDPAQHSDLDAYLSLGRVATYQRKIEDALRIYEYITQYVKVNVPEAYIEMEKLYREKGDEAKAKEMKKKYIQSRN
ncbi:MAG TPA: PQQ-binding-like beta-propeller repeat protein [bacterium]|nr:PQQ-binding-like beta-propeller repeat protein [bacterium]HMW35022.1 PQQ-binding-like beta-propeller repeat protein [bacterium]HMZ04186.1 PQQ-binding-like beta-propeller repeat protein [bacterium]HNB10174.1 PQQ-binding-like beta-propeller repeat protein [bacterium]HNB56942.1 PQQ-binding-like beta-propeller repeat protein [bacterium]